MSSSNDVQCSPLHTLQELNEWVPPKEAEAVLKAGSVNLPPCVRICGLPYGQKMLFCHDMAGAQSRHHPEIRADQRMSPYLLVPECPVPLFGGNEQRHCSLKLVLRPARFKPGKLPAEVQEATKRTNGLRDAQKAKLFLSGIGSVLICSYTSHMPWIDAAHRNSAAILGTFILEWEAGAAICKDLFCGKERAEHAAKQLAKIAAWYGFEGWLVNIESNVDQGVIYVDAFLRTLTSEMHSLRGNQGLVLWYDACDSSGEVHHWCTLNYLNYPFFQACSGIFVDYHWNDSSCRRAQQFVEARRSAGSCQHGPGDIWMGVDVFGRGTFGGGGWNTDVGVAHAREAGLSVALFAPGWYYEDCEPDQWPARAQKFWQAAQAAWHKARVTVRELPLSTSFNTGSGEQFYQAAAAAQGPWYNLSLQDVQPLWLPVEPSRAESSTTQLSSTLNHLYGWSSGSQGQLVLAQDRSTVYDGGCSLHCSGSMMPGSLKVVPLYACDIAAPSKLHVEYVYQAGSGTAAALAVLLAGKEGHECHVMVPTDEIAWQQIIGCESFPCDPSSVTFVNQMECDAELQEPDADKWKRCKFVLESNPTHDKLVSIGLVVSCQEADDRDIEKLQSRSDISVHVGCLLLCEPESLTQGVPFDLQIEGPIRKSRDGAINTVSCCLRWEVAGDSCFRYGIWAKFTSSEHEVPAQVDVLGLVSSPNPVLVGFTHRLKYFVASMPVPPGACSVTFFIQMRFLEAVDKESMSCYLIPGTSELTKLSHASPHPFTPLRCHHLAKLMGYPKLRPVGIKL